MYLHLLFFALNILAFQLNNLVYLKQKTTFAMVIFLDHFRHIENKHETVKKGECSRCHKQFGTKSSAERHEQKCILNFTVPDSIPSEIMNSFPKEKETVKRIMSKNSLTKKCPLCNLFFEKRSNLRRHVLRNNVLANVICMQMKLYFLALFLVEYQMQSMQFKSNVRVYFHV